MKTKLLISFVLLVQIAFSQGNDALINCNTSEANAVYFDNNPTAYQRYKEFNENAKRYKSISSKSLLDPYVIPVVFHVYGTNFNGKTVDDDLIEQAIADLNKDFQGLNDDFNTVNGMFTNIRGQIGITFKLAQKDPNGNVTTGIIYYPNNSGYGNGSSRDAQISATAWDNYKYMNVYIQNDLYNDGVTNNSGVAWYPDTDMSDNNLARVVYNGAYLATNTDKEFASVLTHEFGHWLNLIHTFEGGCNGTDLVDDTPKENGLHNVKCSPGTNCDGDYVNYENYMGYNGTGCYKMFTLGQVDRMIAALDHPARQPLWQEQNLFDTGLKIPANENLAPTIEITAPSNNDIFEENTSTTVTTSITDPNGNGDINRVEFFLDEALVNTIYFYPFGSNTYSDLTIGQHTLKATVYDNGGLSASSEIMINVTKRIYFPEIQWITSTPSYTQNSTEFATGETTTRKIEIRAHTKTQDIIVKGPNNFEQSYTTSLSESIIISDIEPGTWTVEIPAENKKISKTIE